MESLIFHELFLIQTQELFEYEMGIFQYSSNPD